jgi:Ariadne domain
LQALDQLFVARRILGYSYVACFYLFDGVTCADDLTSDQNILLKNLFEDAQGMLEMEVWL